MLVDTAHEPDGVLLVACQNRRATVCPSCAKTYQADAWQLLSAGLRGGKGVPATVASHPRVFATLTAPSFGRVHSRRVDRRGGPRRCHPRPRPDSDLLGYCPHSRPSTCTVKHRSDDPLLGQPLCPDCFDYPGAVLFNVHITALWQNTVLRTRRALAAQLGVPARQLGEHLRVSFGKVAEYQLRGVVHLHVLVRLDGPSPDLPPPATVTTADMQAALLAAARRARATLPGGLGELAWGEQLDVHAIPCAQDGSLEPAVAKVVSYLLRPETGLAGWPGRRSGVWLRCSDPAPPVPFRSVPVGPPWFGRRRGRPGQQRRSGIGVISTASVVPTRRPVVRSRALGWLVALPAGWGWRCQESSQR